MITIADLKETRIGNTSNTLKAINTQLPILRAKSSVRPSKLENSLIKVKSGKFLFYFKVF
jgi:hypothetical protein